MPLSSSVRKRGGLTAAPGEKPRNILVALFAASDKPPSRHSRGARQGHQNRCDYLHLHRPPDPFLSEVSGSGSFRVPHPSWGLLLWHPLTPSRSLPAFALPGSPRPSGSAHFLSRARLPRKSALRILREQGKKMCLPLAQGERRGNRRKLLLHLLRAEAAAPSPLRSLPQAAARRRPGATTLAFPTPAQLRNAQDWGSLPGERAQDRSSAADVRPPRSAACWAAAASSSPGRLRTAPRARSSTGSFLSELQFQGMPGLQHPLRPPPETTFNSPGGSRRSPAGGQRDSGCRGEGGARERRLPECASSFLGEERATLSSRSPRDCSPDVTPPPPTPRRSGFGGWGAGNEDAGV